MNLHERFARAQMVREHYSDFVPFYRDAMKFLGFTTTWMQDDIAEFMQSGGDKLVIQAQRGEAKSTIACIRAVWEIIQNPATRVLAISGSAEKATENAVLIQGMLKHWSILDYLQPDKNAGDRSAVNAFDVHWALKGVNKSPTVRCMGITASLQGYRADLLIPDDVETNKNSLSSTERQKLVQLTKEFTSIVSDSGGKIIYLGTPQTKDSIYNSLPSRGFTVRIWPGRFPDEDTLEGYAGMLAPSILNRMQLLGPTCRTGKGLDGTRGWVTDPGRISETEHCSKEIDQGPETYELQFMLSTSLSDAARQQLRIRDLLFVDTSRDSLPEHYVWTAAPQYACKPLEHVLPGAETYLPASSGTPAGKLQSVTMALDPAGSGGDEMSYAIGGAVGSYVHILAWGGFQGGLTEPNMQKLVDLCKQFDVTNCVLEKNMGHGTATMLVQNYFLAQGADGKKRLPGVGISEIYSTGQKERRIIDCLRPVLQRHRMIVHQTAVETDRMDCQQYPAASRQERSGFYQMQNITTDRGSLEKDDRIDALAILVRQLAGFLSIDEERAGRERQEAAARDFINNPMGHPQGVMDRPRRGPRRRLRR